MKTLFIIPILFLSFVFAQEDTSKWYLEVHVGAGISLRTVSPKTPQDQALFERFEQTLDQREPPALGLHQGFLIGRKLGNRFSLESGFRLSRMKTIIIIDGDTPDSNESRFTNRFLFLSIPLFARLNFKQEKVSYFIFLGPQINWGLNSRHLQELTLNNEEVSRNDLSVEGVFDSPSFSAIGGLGIYFPITPKIDFEGRILAQRDLTTYTKLTGSFNPRFFYIASQVGVRVNL